MAARALRHDAEDTSPTSSDARRTDAKVRRDLDRSREEYGSLLAQARTSREASGRAVAHAAGVNEATLRRWESGETPFAIEALDRLPASVALRFVELVEMRVRARVAPRVSEADYLRSLTAGYAAVLHARDDDAVAELNALLVLSNVARDAAGTRTK